MNMNGNYNQGENMGGNKECPEGSRLIHPYSKGWEKETQPSLAVGVGCSVERLCQHQLFWVRGLVLGFGFGFNSIYKVLLLPQSSRY